MKKTRKKEILKQYWPLNKAMNYAKNKNKLKLKKSLRKMFFIYRVRTKSNKKN